jgi:signal transduction histidine kinase
MFKSKTVSDHLKSRLVAGTIIFWVSIIIAIAAILIEYFTSGHSVLLLAVFALVMTCVISLIMIFIILPVLHCLDTLELWMTDAARSGVVQPVLEPPFLNKSTEPFFRAWNALATRIRANNNMRVKFVERLAHDIRSSLASIQGYAEVLIDYHIGIEGASLQTYGKIIATQTYQLVRMIEDTHTATCIAESQFRLEHQPINLSILMRTLISEARGNSVREIKFQDDLGECTVTGDSFRLREMISKLVDIALSLSTSSVFIHAQVDNDQSGSWIKITVEEHGKTLSEAEIAALFSPFDRFKNSKTSPLFQNSLSFYIIIAIVDGHNGKVIVQPQPGQGTTYTVFLPVQR